MGHLRPGGQRKQRPESQKWAEGDIEESGCSKLGMFVGLVARSPTATLKTELTHMSELPAGTTIESTLTREERLQVLIAEMNLLQGRFDKYDDLFFRNRGWMVTIVVALLGSALTLEQMDLTILAAAVPAVFFLIEVIWRTAYWYKYVVRYRFIRDTLNQNKSIDSISIYDLTHHYGDFPGVQDRLKSCVFKLEPMVFFGGLAVAAIVVRQLLI